MFISASSHNSGARRLHSLLVRLGFCITKFCGTRCPDFVAIRAPAGRQYAFARVVHLANGSDNGSDNGFRFPGADDNTAQSTTSPKYLRRLCLIPLL